MRLRTHATAETDRVQALPRSPLVASATKRHQQVMLDSQPLLLRGSAGQRVPGDPVAEDEQDALQPSPIGDRFSPAYRRLRCRRFGSSGSIMIGPNHD